MKCLLRLSHLIIVPSLLFGLTTAVDGKEVPAIKSTQSDTVVGKGMPVFVRNIDTEAEEAVKVVDAFTAALKAVKLDEVSRLLAPEVLVLESGGSERSRDEYMAQHAAADALFLQKANLELRYRQAHADGNFAWVGTESMLQLKGNEKETVLKTTETMLLKKTADGWKIVHIHWSSRPQVKS